MNLIARKIAHGKIQRESNSITGNLSFKNKNSDGESNFDIQYFDYFQFKQMQNQVTKNYSFFNQIPSINLKTYINDNLGHQQAVMKILDVMRVIDLIRLDLAVFIEYRKHVFTILSQQQLDLKKLMNFSQISYEIESCLNFIFDIVNMKITNLHPNFTIFECFYFIRIKNHQHRKISLLKKFNKRMKKYFIENKSLQDSLYKRFIQAQVCVIGTEFVTHTGSFNQIKYITRNSNKVLKYDKDKLLNSDIKKILPDLISQIHQDFLQTSLAFSQQQVHSLLQSTYLKTQDSSLIKVEMKLMFLPHISSDSS